MNTKKTAIVLVFLIIGAGLVWYRMGTDAGKSGNQGDNPSVLNQQPDKGKAEENNGEIKDDQVYLFVGEGCPHCENVEKFIEENKIADKIKITTLEVFVNKGNQKLYLEAYKKCGKDTKQISVPVMFYKGECIEGDKGIEKKLGELAA